MLETKNIGFRQTVPNGRFTNGRTGEQTPIYGQVKLQTRFKLNLYDEVIAYIWCLVIDQPSDLLILNLSDARKIQSVQELIEEELNLDR